MRGSQLLGRAFGSLLLLGSLLLTNVVTHRTDANSQEAQDLADQQAFLQATLPAPPKRLLVIVPHPDDASLGGTAMIDRTLKNGGQVKLVVMTSGDGFRLAASRTFGVTRPSAQDLFRLGFVRQQEELAAARQLGLRPQDVVFMGYPDSVLHQLWSSSHWNASSSFLAPNGFDHVPYPLAFHQGAPYCGQSVVDDLHAVVDRFQPTDVLFPDPHDIHNDHWATNAFTQYVLGGMPQPPQTWTYLIHYPHFPVPRFYRPQRSLTPPSDMAELDGLEWYTFPLDKSLQAVKQRAIRSHRSQVTVMGDLLHSFLRTNDLVGHYTLQTIRDAGDEGRVPFAETESLFSDTVIHDPAWDDAKNQHVSAADIRHVAMVHSNGQLHICVEYAGEIRANLDYCFRLRLPDVPLARQRRLEFHVQGGKISDNPLTTLTTSWASNHLPQVRIASRRLLLSVPDAPLQQANHLLFSTDVSQNKQTLDKTAWYTLHLQPLPKP